MVRLRLPILFVKRKLERVQDLFYEGREARKGKVFPGFWPFCWCRVSFAEVTQNPWGASLDLLRAVLVARSDGYVGPIHLYSQRMKAAVLPDLLRIEAQAILIP